MEYTRLGKTDFKNNIGNRVYTTFLARDVSVRLQKDKVTKFVIFNMVDKDITLEARLFGASEDMIKLIQEGKVYNAAIDVKPYDKSNTGFSCIVYNIDNSDTPPSYFADWAEGLDKSRNVINNAISNYYETYYGKITYQIITKHWGRFSTWSAASGQHHTQLGGLMKHTAEVVQISDKLAEYFIANYDETFINRPLLICSAILHDVGKVFELDVDTTSGKTDYSKHSILATHIMDILKEVDLTAADIGMCQPNVIDEDNNIVRVKDAAELADEAEAIDLLKHCLAAHHGKLEFGSPITASIPEAEILHMADMLSAIMYKYNRELKSIEPGDFASNWNGGQLSKYYKDTTKLGNFEVD